MTYPIEELPQEIYSLLNNEVQGAVLVDLDSMELPTLKSKYGVGYITPVYHTKSNLILTSEEDCKLFTSREKKVSKVAEVFLEDSATYIGVYSFTSCEFLNELLSKDEEEL